jgi:hypothetical protein
MSYVRLPHMSVTVYTKADPSSLILGCPRSHPTCASCVSIFSLSVRSSAPRHSFALSIPECYVLHLRVFSVYLPFLHHLRATCINAMAVYETTLLWVLPFRVTDQNCVPFFVDPMRAIRCTHFILLYFIIIIMHNEE